MSDVNWFRVIDPLSPLYGCDVRGYDAKDGPYDLPRRTYLNVTGMRRVDIFVGDRPFQLMAPKNENLGLMVLFQQLEPSPLQDDIIELSTELPYGKFLEEIEDGPRGDETEAMLTCVAYEKRYQVALKWRDVGSETINVFSRTIQNHNDDVMRIREAFDRGDDIDDVRYMIERAV
jgi:hypothetical protein